MAYRAKYFRIKDLAGITERSQKQVVGQFDFFDGAEQRADQVRLSTIFLSSDTVLA
jgi:hypothetical protein